MTDILFSIEDDAQEALDVLHLSLEELRMLRGSRSITTKKKLLYSYLRKIKGYSWHEIGNYCHKDHSTIVKTVQSSEELWLKHSQMFTKKWYNIR